MSAAVATDAAPRRRPSRRAAWLAATLGLPAAGLAWTYALFDALPPAPIRTAAGGLVLALLLVCTFTDLRRHKIYNWATYPAFLLALSANAIAPWLDEATRERLGLLGPWPCVLGALVGFVGLFVGYNLSGGGAGDVKLAFALGAWLGPAGAVHLLVYTYAIGGVVTLSVNVWRDGAGHVLGGLLRRVGSTLLPGWVAPPSEGQALTLRRVAPMSPFFAAAGLLVLLGVVP